MTGFEYLTLGALNAINAQLLHSRGQKAGGNLSAMIAIGFDLVGIWALLK